MQFERYSRQAAEAVLHAEQRAHEGGHRDITPEHLLLAFLHQERGAFARLTRTLSLKRDALYQKLRSELQAQAHPPLATGQKPGFHLRLLELFRAAERASEKRDAESVQTGDLLLAMLEEGRGLAVRILTDAGLERAHLHALLEGAPLSPLRRDAPPTPGNIPTGGVTVKALVSSPHQPLAEEQGSALATYGQDWSHLALREAGALVERGALLRQVQQILCRRTKHNPLLIGEPGVGRTSLVKALALQLSRGQVPGSLARCRLVALDVGSLLAGARYRGDLEERFQRLLKELSQTRDEVILLLPDIHDMLRAEGGQSSVDLGRYLKPALLRGELRCIATTTPSGFRRGLEKDAALERLFQKVEVAEPSETECLLILRGVKAEYETHHGVQIADDALSAAIGLSKRYLPDRRLPDKALDLLDEAASRLHLSMESMPAAIDGLQRTLVQWRIEQQALLQSSPEEAAALAEEMRSKEAELHTLEERWRFEKQCVTALQVLQDKREQLSKEREDATEAGEYEQAAQLQYGPLLALQQEEAALRLRLPQERAERLVRQDVDAQDIAAVVAEWTGIPVARMLESERSKLLRMEDVLEERVKGQREAVEALAKTIRRSRSGLADPNKPIGSFLFLGSTGVGKTELAKALAEFLFDDEQVLIRFDMSEFMEKQAALRLTGAPPGYTGYQEGGQLTEAVRRHPYSVVLFDEIEKAHPDVFHLLLQVLDDGHLTDSQGRRADFKNTVVILTSNLGANELLGGAGLDQVRPLLLKTLRPELLNRIEEVLCFRPLSDKVLREILESQLEKLRHLMAAQGLTLDCSDAAQDFLLAAGTDPAFGARPLKRALVQLVQNPLSRKLLEGTCMAGDHISLDVGAGELTFSVQAPHAEKSGEEEGGAKH